MTETDLYKSMLRIRRVEEAIAKRYAAQEIRCPIHLSIGQEGVAVGVCAALQPGDWVFSNHRSHGHYLAKGGNLIAFIAELYGRENGCCRGVGGSMHLMDWKAGFLGAVPVVGATLPIAVGAAWAARLKGEDRVIAVFFGDGCFEEGVTHESMNFALLHRLPVLFVCENNLYSCYTRITERQPQRSIYKVAAAQGCSACAASGNDVKRVRAVARELVQSLRNGGAPAFLECATYRWREHCGPNLDDDFGYRPVNERREWEAECPIARLGSELRTTVEGMRCIENAEAEIAEEIEAAFTAALSGKYPDPADLKGYLYA